jgi:hypothetical protein
LHVASIIQLNCVSKKAFERVPMVILVLARVPLETKSPREKRGLWNNRKLGSLGKEGAVEHNTVNVVDTL